MSLVVISLLFTAVFGATLQTRALEAPLSGYGVEELSWNVEITPNGQRAILNGTIEQVAAQLDQLNPNWKTDFHFNEAVAVSSKLSKRDNFNSFNCRGRWEGCDTGAIRNGVNYLYGVSGQPSNGPGPGNCGRVSCSYTSAIWWCNDATYTTTLPGFGLIATGAKLILDNCAFGDKGQFVSGQAFTDANWNVIVRRDHDHC